MTIFPNNCYISLCTKSSVYTRLGSGKRQSRLKGLKAPRHPIERPQYQQVLAGDDIEDVDEMHGGRLSAKATDRALARHLYQEPRKAPG